MEQSIQGLLKTTPTYINKLKENRIVSLEDFCYTFPRTYEDRTSLLSIQEIIQQELDQTQRKQTPVLFGPDQEIQSKIVICKLQIKEKKITPLRGGSKIASATGIDIHGQSAKLMTKFSTFTISKLQKEKRYFVIAKPVVDQGQLIFWHPECIPAHETDETKLQIGGYYPIYPELQGIKTSRRSSKMRIALDHYLPQVKDPLPEHIRTQYQLITTSQMIEALHFPNTLESLQAAQRRLFFDRLLHIQIIAQLNRSNYIRTKPQTSSARVCISDFLAKLPFELTNAQKKAIKEIIDEIDGPTSMMKLLQGDVGSGKTIVAVVAAYYIIKQYQGQIAVLAPLEVLAQQHMASISKLLLPLGIRVELLTGSLPASKKKSIKDALAAGHIDIIIGTHAIIQDDIEFHNLKLAIIDEQHKFGVKQRAFFQHHNSPHLLQMTATPIPRSLALAFFGEFTVSIIDEMPAGRKPIISKIISESEYHKLKPRILTKISQGQRVYVITPLINESEQLDEVNSATAMYEEITTLYPELQGQIGLLHGQMKSKEKDQVMLDFKAGKYVVLVSTTVIEVGIDVPEATVMIIKNAERFGLSQLHQIRGRVGRSDLQSYCFLETKHKNSATKLKHLETTTDGFALAEIDLQMRGSGEFLGTRQSGESTIPAHILTDTLLLEQVKTCSLQLLTDYPDLQGLDILHHQLQSKLSEMLV